MPADSAADLPRPSMTLEFLGTGTSVGVPVIGCGCAVCTSDDPRNARMRSSAVLRYAGQTFLIDSGPDLRQQALAYGLTTIDAVIYTHGHVDHVAGFDEMRAFCWGRKDPLPLFATPGCLATLNSMFGWAFSIENTAPGYIKPGATVIDGPFQIGDLTITPIPVQHGSVQTIGLRFDAPNVASLAYIPDVKTISELGYERLAGLDTLIIDALRAKPHTTHMSIDESLAATARINARRAYFTHISHETDHATVSATLPDHVALAYDGLTITQPPSS